jgi:hypothetical protein
MNRKSFGFGLLVILLTQFYVVYGQNNVQYAELRALSNQKTGWELQFDAVDLVAPAVAVSRGSIRPEDARHYKAVLSNQNPQVRNIRVSSTAKVTLLTFPAWQPKITSLATLQQMVEFDEALPSEYEYSPTFALSIEGNQVVAIEQVNERSLSGVLRQAVFVNRQSKLAQSQLTLDYINVYTQAREMRRDGRTIDDFPGGLYLSNTNPQLRSFLWANTGQVWLFKAATNHVPVTWSQFADALAGKFSTGVYVDWDSYFWVKISDQTNQAFELKQGYTP